jgi:ethanolamine permease
LIFLIVAVLYFVLYSRHKLVAQAPEEEDALLGRALKEIDHPHGIDLQR